VTAYNQADILAQDYQISFAGTGAANVVTSVKVENLTQGTNLDMSGTNVLHLVNSITGIEEVLNKDENKITFSPNPVSEFTKMKFYLPDNGEVFIALYDVTGKCLYQTKDYLSRGLQIYDIQGIEDGLHVITVKSKNYSVSGRFLGESQKSHSVRIVYENTILAQPKYNTSGLKEPDNSSKGISGEVLMQYNAGERLKYTGTSGDFNTVITDIPIESKALNFNFVPCTDSDGNNYPIVLIGEQIWMAENLKTTKYSDGTSIPNVTDNAIWASQTNGVYSDYENTPANSAIYGKLYNGYTILSTNAKNVCPTGWHVPSDAEWKTMEDYLMNNGYNFDGSTSGYLFAKSLASTMLWRSWFGGAVGSTEYPEKRNSTGFTALPGGNRLPNGEFMQINDGGYFWSSSGNWSPCLFYNSSAINLFAFDENLGFSVRCIKDN
jgi:uncharacterized protein (TIGR02145 family)